MSTSLSTHIAPLPASDAIFQGFFASLASRGLADTTLANLSADNHWPLATLRREWPTIGHILSNFIQSITQTMQNDVVIDAEAAKRDLYFELLMARLDALQPYKNGLIRLSRDLPSRPDLVAIVLRETHAMANTILELTGDDWPLWQRPVKRLALTALYARLLYVWQKDDTADLSKSMAFLDTQLERLDRWFSKATNTSA